MPPESLAQAKRLEYVQGMGATGEMPRSSHGHFFSTGPSPSRVRTAGPAGMVLPFASNVPDPADTLPAAAANVVKGGPFDAKAPDAGTVAQVEGKLEAALPYDKASRDFTPLPMPFRDLDAVQLYYTDSAFPPFNGVLGLDHAGLLGDGDLPAELPELLLETRETGATLGEVDPLLLRAPIRGRFRFERYLVYCWQGNAFAPVGPSNSGRVILEQQALPGDPADVTSTQVRVERRFAFDHVDRESVAEMVHALLMLQVAFLDGIVKAIAREDGAEERLAIPKPASSAFAAVLTSVNVLMRAWTAFLSVLAWRNEDTAVAAAVPAEWFGAFPARDMRGGDAAKLVEAAGQVLGDDGWLESLVWYSENVHSRRLAGFSWLEILAENQPAAGARRFPVPKDQPPFSTDDKPAIAQHERLRVLEDPQFRFVGCYAGAPLGRPSTAYAPPGGAPTVKLPSNGLTTYDVEVLHAAGTAQTALGLGAPVTGPGPQPGKAMDLSGYSATAEGRACTFTAGRLGSDTLHTTADWLLELTCGIHFNEEEAPFLDLAPLMDPATGVGHPLIEAVRFVDHLKAVHLRRQMSAPGMTQLGLTSIDWWKDHIGFQLTDGKWHHVAKQPPHQNLDRLPSPQAPYQGGKTVLDQQGFPAVLEFIELILGLPSGFDLFDLESAYLACARMADPIDSEPHLPVPVLLAIMEREGNKLFAPLTRKVINTTDETKTLVWETASRSEDDQPGPVAEGQFPARPDERARVEFLLFPYALDTFAQRKSAAGMDLLLEAMEDARVLTLQAGESAGEYLRDRVFSTFLRLPDIAANAVVPRIWKRSRRMHWVALALEAGFFRQLERQIRSARIDDESPFRDQNWTPSADWLPAGSSPPDLTGKGPTSTEWKDYLTYYGLIYLAYNDGPGGWKTQLKAAEAARPAASTLSLRDFLVFKHDRTAEVIGNIGRFVAGLDAFLRLDYMEDKNPADFAAAGANTTAPAGRNWGVP